MYVPAYKQAILLVLGVLLAVVSITKLLRLRNASCSTSIYSDGGCVPKNFSAPTLPLRTKYNLMPAPVYHPHACVIWHRRAETGRHKESVPLPCPYYAHSALTYGIWYSLVGGYEWKRARLVSELDISALCKYLKDTISMPAGSRRVANALWHLSLDKDKFVRFREQRIGGYDEKLEDAVLKSMQYVIEKILAKFGSFRIEHNDHGDIRILRTGNGGTVEFETPNLGMLSSFDYFLVIIGEKEGGLNENVWIHQVWHALRVMCPALREFGLMEDPDAGRKLTHTEMMSVGHCIGVQALGISTCAGPGQMRHLKGTAISNSIDTLVLRGLVLQDSDVDAISSFSMHELFFYRTSADVGSHSLAKLLEHRTIADRLAKLHLRFHRDIQISERETKALASLRNIWELTLMTERGKCNGCITRILDDTHLSTRLSVLSLTSSSVSLPDLDVVAGLSIKSLLLSCRKVTREQLLKISAGAAGLSIAELELWNTDANTIFGSLAEFGHLTTLKLRKYTASAQSLPSSAQLHAGTKQLKRLELTNDKLHNSIAMLVAIKHDLEELVLAVDELSGSELAIILTNKKKLRTLEITGGNVMGYCVSVIADLGALTSLKLRNVTMTYDGLVRLASDEKLKHRLQSKLRLRARVPPLGKQEVGVLRSHGLVYENGAVICCAWS